MRYDIELNSAAHLPANGVIELARGAEAAGFECVWKGESNSTDPLVLLSGIATVTRDIRLGTAVYHVFARSPVTIGMQAATLQDLSGGRFVLGLGVANKTIAGWHGGTFDRPLQRAREYIDIVRRVAAGERVEYEGEVYSTGRRFQLAWRPRYPDLPVYLAGLGPRMTRLVGHVADGLVLNMATPDRIREIVSRVRAGAAEAGRDPERIEIVAKVRMSLNPDRAAARSRLRQVLTFYNLADHYSDMLVSQGFGEYVGAVKQGFAQGGFKAAMASLTDEYMDRLPVVPATSIGEIRERIAPFREAGVTRLIIPYVPCTGDVMEDVRSFLRAWEREGAHV